MNDNPTPTQDNLLHKSDCAVHNEPAYPKGKCDCGADTPTQMPEKSDTPRTDIEAAKATDINGGVVCMVNAGFARQLEREISAARQQIAMDTQRFKEIEEALIAADDYINRRGEPEVIRDANVKMMIKAALKKQ